jgi:hydroxypyruvate reductase
MRYGHAVATRRIEVVAAAHPVPDAASEIAALPHPAMRGTLGGADDLVLALVSGCGSRCRCSSGPPIARC